MQTGESAGLSIPGAFGDEPKGAPFTAELLVVRWGFPSGNLGGNAGILPSHVNFSMGSGGFLFLLIPEKRAF